MKKIFSAILFVLSMLFCMCFFTACDEFFDQIPHTHFFSQWKYNEDAHWQECICGYITNRQAHNASNDVVISQPDCEKMGLSSGSYCLTCKKVYVEQYDIQALGHDFGLNDNTNATVLTRSCTQSGGLLFECKREGCNATYIKDQQLPLGHDFQTEGGRVTTKPTCTEGGYTKFTCQREGCGYSYTGNEVEKLGHLPLTKATCEVDEVCVRCNKLLAEKFGHNVKEVVVIEVTCTKSGEKCVKCVNEGCEYVESKTEINPLGHDYNGKNQTTSLPTCCTKGNKIIYCTRCNAYKNQPIQLDKNNHEGDVGGDGKCDKCRLLYTALIPKKQEY